MDDLITAIATVVVAGGGTLVFVRQMLANLERRVSGLEQFKKEVKVPNVGEAMCHQKHGVVDKALEFFMACHKELTDKISKDHDVLVKAATKIDNIDNTLKKLNGRT